MDFSTFFTSWHTLTTKILRHTRKCYIFLLVRPKKKNGCNFDSFAPDSYCCVGWCPLLFYRLRKQSQHPASIMSYCMLKVPAAHCLKIAGIGHSCVHRKVVCVCECVCERSNSCLPWSLSQLTTMIQFCFTPSSSQGNTNRNKVY